MKRATIVLVAVIGAVTSGIAVATPGADLVAKDLGRSTFDEVTIQEADPSDVVYSRVELMEDGFTGWHSHPGETYVLVKRGALTIYHDDCSSQTYSKGDVFHEPAGSVHNAVNETDDETKVIATYFGVPVGGSVRIDEPAPSCAD
jgi:quercetin dioxygenase-like cupin family protein